MQPAGAVITSKVKKAVITTYEPRSFLKKAVSYATTASKKESENGRLNSLVTIVSVSDNFEYSWCVKCTR